MKIINLLPKPRQKELYYYFTLRTLWLVASWSLASFAAVFLAQLGVKFYLQIKSRQLNNEVAALQQQIGQQQNTDVKQQVKTENNLIADYTNLTASSPKWSQVIKAFAPLPPAGLKISSFVVNPADDSVTIAGLSPTRDLVIQLYNNILRDQRDFYGIDYPLENIAQPTEVNFHFTFYIQSKLLH